MKKIQELEERIKSLEIDMQKIIDLFAKNHSGLILNEQYKPDRSLIMT